MFALALRFRAWLVARSGQAFYWLGLMCASNPFRVMVAIIIAVLVASAPLLMATVNESPVEVEVWCPQSASKSSVRPDWFYYQEPSSRLQQFFFSSNDGSNIVEKSFIHEHVWNFTRTLDTFVTKVQDQQHTLRSFCRLADPADPASPCVVLSIAGLWPSEDDFLADRHVGTTIASHQRFDMYNISLDRASVLVNPQPGLRAMNASGLAVTIVLRSLTNETDRHHEHMFFNKLRSHVFGGRDPGHTRDDLRHNHETYAYYFSDHRKVAEKTYLVVAYLLVFAYIYFVVGKFEYVKSKAGLGLAAVAIVIGSMSSSIGIAIQFNLASHVMAVEVLPFFVMAVGLENMRLITRSVVATSPFHPVRFRVAQGLARAAVPLLQSLMTMEGALFLGIASRITALQEFCVVACIGILADFVLQVVFYVAVLSVDIRRVELSDLAHTPQYPGAPPGSTRPGKQAEEPEDPLQLSLAPTVSLRTSVLLNNAFMALSMIATVVLAFWDSGANPVSARVVAQGPGCPPRPSPIVAADWRGPLLHQDDSSLPHFISFLPVYSHTFPPIAFEANDLPDEPSVFERMLHAAWFYVQALFGVLTVGGTLWLITIKVVGKTKAFLSGERETDEALAALSLSNLDVRTLRGHRQEIECLTVFDGSRSDLVASACLGGQVRIWDTAKGRCLDVLRCGYDDLGNTHAPTPWCLAARDEFVAVGQGNGDVEMYDLDSGQCFTLRGLPDDPTRPAGDHSGIACVVFANEALYTASCSGVLERWEWNDEDIPDGSDDADNSADHGEAGVRIHRTAAFLMTASFSASARPPSQLTTPVPRDAPSRVLARRLSVSPLTAGPGGSPAANAANGSPLATIVAESTTDAADGPPTPRGGRIISSVSAQDLTSTKDIPLIATRTGHPGQIIFTSSPATTSFLSSHAPKSTATLTSPGKAISPASSSTVTGTGTGTGTDSTPSSLANIEPTIPASFNFNSEAPGSGGKSRGSDAGPDSKNRGREAGAHRRARSDGGRIDLTTYLQASELLNPARAVEARAVPLTVRHTRSGSFDSTSSVSAQSVLVHPELAALRPRRRFTCVGTMAGHRTAITCMRAAGSHLLTASTDRTLKLFDKDLNCVLTMYGHEGPVTTIDLAHIVTVSGATTNTSSSPPTSPSSGPAELSTLVCASGSSDHCVRLWLVRSGMCLRVLKGHQDAVLCVRLNQDYVVSSSEDDSVRVWLAATGRCVRVMDMRQAIVDMALHASSILLTAIDGAVVAWDLVAGGERVRTIPLNEDDTLPLSQAGTPFGLSSTSHVMLMGNRLLCDHGAALKTVTLPLPTTRKKVS